MSGHSELSPCPFCGGADIRAESHKDDFEHWRFDIMCRSCGAAIGFSEDALPYSTEAEDQKLRDECQGKWNRRAPGPLVGQLVEALEATATGLRVLSLGESGEKYFPLINYIDAALSAAAAAKEGRS